MWNLINTTFRASAKLLVLSIIPFIVTASIKTSTKSTFAWSSTLITTMGICLTIYLVYALVKKRFGPESLCMIMCYLIASFSLIYITFNPIITGDSMYPSVKNGQRITCYPVTKIKYADLVIFSHIKSDGTSETVLKRVIGLPGDTIQINDWGDVYRNSKVLDEPYLSQPHSTNHWEGGFTKANINYRVPAKHYFVLGDNRHHSSDSREYGFVSESNISCYIPWEKK